MKSKEAQKAALEARRAVALRENLKRRKTQEKQRDTATDPTDEKQDQENG